MNTVKDNFYFVEDVMDMLGLSRSKSYKIIKQLNDELEGQGYMKVSGRVPKRYFDKRFYCEPAEAATKAPRRSSRAAIA